MTDVPTSTVNEPERTLLPPPIQRVGRPSTKIKHAPMGLSRKVKAAIDLMVFEGATRPAAAKTVGLADNSLRLAFRNPQVMRHHSEQLEVLRTSLRARALHQIDHLSQYAVSERVQLDASKHLDGGDKGAGVTVNVGLGVNVAPGYMVDVTGHQSGAQQILDQARSRRNLLTDNDVVPDGT